jgi:hypothetical protein
MGVGIVALAVSNCVVFAANRCFQHPISKMQGLSLISRPVKTKGGTSKAPPVHLWFRVGNQLTDVLLAAAVYREAACLALTTLSFGSMTPRFLTTLKMPLLAWAMYMFIRA